MFKIIECDQRSPEWGLARLGLFTASVFSKVITSTGKKSTSSNELINRLVGEIIVGKADETFQSEAMLRGIDLEDEALDFINFSCGYNFKKVGFIDSELGYGCSPDGLDQEAKIGLEMKIPSHHTHVEYISENGLPAKYKAQVQGSMLITGYKEWVFFSYSQDMKPLILVVDRDEEYIKALKDILTDCCKEVVSRKEATQRYLDNENDSSESVA